MKRREFFAAIGVGLGIPLLGSDVCFQDPEGRKLEVRRGGKRVWFVDTGKVNLHDLLGPPRQDKIVRTYGNPHECVMVCNVDV